MSDIAVSLDLRSLFGPARDQGTRPTCLAFAASDAHAAHRAGWVPLSCEYAFYHAQRRAGRSAGSGALLPSMLDALRKDGQPGEDGWPYLAETPSALAWAPPPDVGSLFGRDGRASGTLFEEIVGELNNGRPVIVLLVLSRSFFAPSALGVVDQAPGEVPVPAQRHAVIAVGQGEVDGESAILIRNSWGLSWGSDGHAWLTERFLAPRLFAAATLTEEVDVSAHSVAA